MTRAQTLVFALLALHALLGVLCVVIAGRDRAQSLPSSLVSPALRWWGWGLLIYAAGLLATIATLWLPPAFALTLGNGLVTVASVLCAMGVLAHTRYDLPRLPVDAALLATVGVLAFANFSGMHAGFVNLVAPTPIATVVFAIAAWKVFRQGPEEARVASRFLALCLVLAIATWLLRIAVMSYASGGTWAGEEIDLTVSFFAIAQMVNGVAATLSLLWVDVRLMQADLARVAHTDFLTGLPNRRSVLLRFREEIARAERGGGRFALVVLDIDRFKQINDRHGHAAGDAVLKEVSRCLVCAKRAHDVLGRIGGEEFVVIMPQQGADGAREAAERFREAVAKSAVVVAGATVRATASGGLAMYPDDGEDWDHVFAAADRRLYEAKRGGRDRIQAAG
jgi:diguanylate cyclase (GGDEF)-like protein